LGTRRKRPDKEKNKNEKNRLELTLEEHREKEFSLFKTLGLVLQLKTHSKGGSSLQLGANSVRPAATPRGILSKCLVHDT
jgi:hypothetical protein